jgi:hypothetical protein
LLARAERFAAVGALVLVHDQQVAALEDERGLPGD